VVVYARNPSKLPKELVPRLEIIEGTLESVDGLTKAIHGVDVILSALGPVVRAGPFHSLNAPLAKAYEQILDIMKAEGVKRLIALGTTSIKDKKHDKFSLTFLALVSGVATFATSAWHDVVECGKVIMNNGEDIEWTIVRVPVLTDAKDNQFVAGYVGDGKTKPWLSRTAYANFVMEEVVKRNWVHQLPLVSSP